MSLADVRDHSLNDSICVGDLVCLFSDEVRGFLFANQTSQSDSATPTKKSSSPSSAAASSVFSGVAVEKSQNRESPKIPDSQIFAFEIVTVHRYKLNLKYREKLQKAAANPDNDRLQVEVKKAKIAKEKEDVDNQQDQQRLTGKQLQYGQEIQLRHVFSKKYIQISTTRTSVTESNNMLVKLVDYNSKQCQFKVMPRFKVKAEGDTVHAGDQIAFESVKTPGQFLHVNNAQFPPFSQYPNTCCECKLAVLPSGFSIYRQCVPYAIKENQLKAGSLVRFFHRELEAYLVAEGLFNHKVVEDVHLRVRAMDPNKPSTLLPSSSAITYWQVEKEEATLDGGTIGWQQQVRLRHMTTRKYLRLGDALELTDDHKDPLTVFRLHRVMQKGDIIMYGSYCRIEHVVSKCWLGGSSEVYTRQQKEGSGKSFDSLKYTFAPLRKVVKVPDMKYDDAFTIQVVEKELVEVFNFMAGMVPFMQNTLADLKNNFILNAKYAHQMITAVKEISDFLIVDGDPVKKRQKLLRHLKIIEILIDILRILVQPKRSDKIHLVDIFAEIFQLISVYLMGESRKNELYIAKHIPFFLELINYPEPKIALQAVCMVTEVMRDNRRIVNRVTVDRISHIIELLKKQKNHRYLDLLSVLCLCNKIGMTENQNRITDAWLGSEKSVEHTIYLTELGERIDRDKGVVYISIDAARTWIPLRDFAPKKGEKNEEYIFLEKQLDLLASLAYGRNKQAIEVITIKRDLLSWDEAFVCLQDEEISEKLRSKYCDLIIRLYVDVPGNSSWLDRINLSYEWNNLGMKQKGASQQMERNEVTEKNFPALRDWIQSFLAKSEFMVARRVNRNMLICKVLRLVYLLIEYGFYDTTDIQMLMKSLVNVLDGRKDKLFIFSPEKGLMDAEQWKEVQETYTQKDRFLQSQETKAIVDAKYQALCVVDLMFDILMTTRLEEFIGDFKETITQARDPAGSNSELTPLLNQQFKLEGNEKCASECVVRIKSMFKRTAFFYDDFIPIILDLSNYQYNKIIRQSMTLLNRIYSAYDSIFQMGMKAQVFLTEESCRVMKIVQKQLPELKRLKSAKLDQEQLKSLCEILEQFNKFCALPEEHEQRHPMNQTILYNHDILDDIFDILSQETDNKLQEQFKITCEVFQSSFRLLRGMARGNPEVQRRLFDRLDMLLNIEGAPNELGEVLLEMFRDNRKICFNILPFHIQTIMGLVALHKTTAPHLLEALRALVKVKRLPLKRNQIYVVKYFMQYRGDVAAIIDKSVQSPKQILDMLSQDSDNPELCYLIALVDLVAACTEGEQAFIESICQTIFSLDLLLTILCSETIDNNRKRPFLRFFVGCYLTTARGLVESGAKDLAHDERLWKLITQLLENFKSASTFAAANQLKVKELLKRRPQKTLQAGGNEETKIHGTFHFLLDAGFYFLEAWIEGFFSNDPNFDQNKATVNDLARAVLSFAEHVGPQIRDERQQRTMVNGINAILSASSMSAEVNQPSGVSSIGNQLFTAEKFLTEYGMGRPRSHKKSDAVTEYEAYYREEEKLKTEFDVFALNYRTAYRGKNMVKDQIGFPSEKAYTQPDDDEELPLGEEFQQLTSCFVNSKGKTTEEIYAPAKVLVEQLRISANSTLSTLSENIRLEQEKLDVKCLQILRALVHNEIVKLPTEVDNSSACKRQISTIREVQSVLNQHGAVLDVLPQLSRPSDNVARETLAFLSTILFGGNKQVQKSLFDYFLNTREESFFLMVKNAIETYTVLVKERRILREQQQVQVEFAQRQARVLQLTMGRTTTENGNAPAKAHEVRPASSKAFKKNQILPSGSKLSDDLKLVEIKVEQVPAPAPRSSVLDDDDDIIDDKNEGHIKLVLRVLSLICDGQNRSLQDYLREQPDNIKTYNLVAITARLLFLVYSDVDLDTVDFLIELFSSLSEFSVGNLANQVVLFDAKVVDCVNFIMRLGRMATLQQHPQKQYELYFAIGQLMKIITEENNPQNMKIVKESLETLDTERLYTIVLKCHLLLFPEDGSRTNKELRSLAKRVGFLYYHLIRRMEDLLPETVDARSRVIANDEKKEEALEYYDEHSMSVEVLRDNDLHRIYFYVADPSVLREEVKEKFNYSVERASPTDKLRDFIHWSREIMSDMKHQKRILANPVARVLVNGWWWLNVSCILLSLGIAATVLAGWTSPDSILNVRGSQGYWPKNYTYIPIVDIQVDTTLLVLGTMHNFLSLVILVSYFLTNRPRLPKLDDFRGILPFFPHRHNDKEDMRLRRSVLSFKTLYYFLFLAASILGTIYDGYFQSLHLLHIVNFNHLLGRAILAVTQNGKALLWVALLILFLLYVYSLLAFAFFRPLFIVNSGSCATMHQCFLSIVHGGLLSGLYNFLNAQQYDDVFRAGKFFLDVSFYIIMSTIMLNIVFGIIVDAFSELRDAKLEIDNDMKNCCFICNHSAYDFEHQAKGFTHHIKKEHYQWAYLFFFLYLDATRKNDYSGLELFVSQQFEENKLDFFPLNRALSLTSTEDTQDSKMEALLKNMKYLVAKKFQEEAQRQQKLEKSKQDRWEELHIKAKSKSTPK